MSPISIFSKIICDIDFNFETNNETEDYSDSDMIDTYLSIG